MIFGPDVQSMTVFVGLCCRNISLTNRNMTILKSNNRNLSYDEAVTALNSLQTNAITLKKTRKERQANVHLNLPITRKYLERSGMSLDDLDQLKIIHVSGTKGKGSTCAFSESILRHSGLKTGFYSSPHLVSVTERIRINGQPIDQEKFTSYFWSVYDKVCKGKEEEDRPPYFKFLTILAFNIFFRENVDVAVIEVGIGGEYDCTNIIRKPVVTGITSLGLDHTSLLGNSISEIAWHKAGIMKRGVPCYVDPHQKADALEVIARRGEELGSRPQLASSLQDLTWPQGEPPRLGLYGEVQAHNASLAVALTSHFLARSGAGPSESVVRGLERTEWPGRSQVVRLASGVQLFLDGAHTEESMQSCRQWFSRQAGLQADGTAHTARVLIFNTTGDREVSWLLSPLASLNLDLVIFCTNISRQSRSVDQQNFNTNFQIQLARCESHSKVWREVNTSVPSITIPCYDEALISLTSGRLTDLDLPHLQTEPRPGHNIPASVARAEIIQILVTGSLHLVGGVLGLTQS